MGRAARELHRVLSRMLEGTEGVSDAELWSRHKIRQLPPTKKTAGGIELRKAPAVVAAVAAYAARGVRDMGARTRGLDCGHVAILLARNLITPEQAAKQSSRWRDGARIQPYELLGVNTHRSERERWREAYRVMAWDADVWPLPETKRGLRRDLLKLYETVSKPVTVVDPKTGKVLRAYPDGKGRLIRDKES